MMDSHTDDEDLLYANSKKPVGEKGHSFKVGRKETCIDDWDLQNCICRDSLGSESIDCERKY